MELASTKVVNIFALSVPGNGSVSGKVPAQQIFRCDFTLTLLTCSITLCGFLVQGRALNDIRYLCISTGKRTKK